MAKNITGEISYKDGVGWKRVNTFKDMYFAFLTTAAVMAPPSSDDSCGWCESIPPSPDGMYFCGVSPPAPSESMARDLAMRNAREQVVKHIGETLTARSTTDASLVKGYLDDKEVTTAAASGIASQVKDRKWCKAATTDSPDGTRYTAKVLAFVSSADGKAATQAVVSSIIASAERAPDAASRRHAAGESLRKLRDMVK